MALRKLAWPPGKGFSEVGCIPHFRGYARLLADNTLAKVVGQSRFADDIQDMVRRFRTRIFEPGFAACTPRPWPYLWPIDINYH